MSVEQGSNSTTLFIKEIGECFKKASGQKGERELNISSKELELKDGTHIKFNVDYIANKALFTVNIYPFGKKKSDDDSTVRFAVDKDRKLRLLFIPKISLKVGEITFKKFEGEMTSCLGLGENTWPECSKENELTMGSVMIGWLESIIEKNEYKRPPITASVK